MYKTHVIVIIALCNSLTAQIPLSAEFNSTHYDAAMRQSRNGNYLQAISHCTDMIEADPRHYRSYDLRGHCQYLLNQHELALADYNTAIELCPDSVKYKAEILNNRAVLYKKTGKHQKALRGYANSIISNPDYIYPRYNLAILQAELGDYENAIKGYLSALKIDPKNLTANNNLAWLYATCPDPKYHDGGKAVQYAHKACEVTNWKNPNILETYSVALARAGEYEEAIVHLHLKKSQLTADGKATDFVDKLEEMFLNGMPYSEPGVDVKPVP